MKAFEAFQNGLDKLMGPLAKALSENKYIRALTLGMMSSMPITLGVAAFAILGNLPVAAWQSFLVSTGLYQHMQDIITATSSMLAIYLVATIGYAFTKGEGQNGIVGAVMSMGAFIVLMPQTITVGDTTINALSSNNLGSNGIFVAIMVALIISTIYCALMKKGIKLALPDTVPPMVSDSLSPTFVAMIVFAVVFFVRVAIAFTSYGDIFTLVNTLVSAPVMAFGASPWSLIGLFTFMNLCWFFGIHPSPILSVYLPVLLSSATANIEAFQAGARGGDLPYLGFSLMFLAVYIGGNGNTLGLVINMFAAKSDRYKALRKVALIPNLFNINEPLVFGTPIMLNPIFLVPMVSTSFIGGLIGFVFIRFGAGSAFNPTIQMPWVTPSFITALLAGGFFLMLMVLTILAVQTVIWLPFFKVADAQALREEKEMFAQTAVVQQETVAQPGTIAATKVEKA